MGPAAGLKNRSRLDIYEFNIRTTHMAPSSDQNSRIFEMFSCPGIEPGMACRGGLEYQCGRNDGGLLCFKGNTTVFNDGDFMLSTEPGVVFANP